MTNIIIKVDDPRAAEEELLTLLNTNPRHRLDVVYHFKDPDQEAVSKRLAISFDHQVMELYKGKRNRGWYLESRTLSRLSHIEVKLPAAGKTPEEVWRISWGKVLKRLQASGLWPEIIQNIVLALEIGYENIRAANDAQWDDFLNVDYPTRAAKVKAIDSRLVQGEDDILSDLSWLSRPAKIKKMYFGKYRNEPILAQIAGAMQDQRDFEIGNQAGYDVSFSYRHPKAWYSEEYRGCGNGHYYLALDATHAIYYEDD